MNRKLIVASILSLAVAGAAFAQEVKPEDQIKYRKAGYSFMAWNMGKIKANLDGAYNKDQVAAAATAIASIAGSGMGALYGPGTDKDVGSQKTRVKPEMFTDKDGVAKVAIAFNKEAGELAKVAATGDAAAVKAQFAKVGDACKSCHDKFRNKD